MPIADAIIAELDREATSTTKMLERVPSDKLDWRPHAKSMTLGELAWHIATIPARSAEMLRHGRFDVATARPGPAPADAVDIVATYRRNLDELRALLGATDDAAIMSPFSLVRGDRTLMSMPRIGMLRSITLNHSYHHRGQLSVYLRLLDIPLPAIYGTSADENPFRKE